jgi:hypothetical protein
MWVSNSANGHVQYFSALSNWVSPPVPLVVGANDLWVMGANASGSQAFDSVTMLRGIPGTGRPVIYITNGRHFVTFDVASYALAGTNNPNVLAGGTMWVSNAANGAGAAFGAAHAWQAPGLPLVVGTNSLSAYATNMFGAATNATVVVIREPAGSGVPFVDVLTPVTNVDSTVTTFALTGTNNLNVVGTMGVSNAANLYRGTFTAAPTWTSTPATLVVGYNGLVAWGTNAFGDSSSDATLVTRGTPGYGPPVITLTSTNSSFNYDVAGFSVKGVANFNVIGGMWVSNAANGDLHAFAATQFWTATPVALSVGPNVMTVYGTNLLDDVTNATVTITRGDQGTGKPVVAITTTPTTVSHEVTSLAVAGTNNDNVVGTMWVSNDTQATYHTFPAQPAWTAPSVLLDRHANLISVGGTNLFGDLHVDTVLIDRAVPVGVTNYCAVNGTHEWPFLTWATAATNLQLVIDEAPSGNTVMTGPGSYMVREMLRIDRPFAVRSSQGASNTIVTFLNVTGTCVRVIDGVLDGYTLRGSASDPPVTTNGGGVYMSGGVVVNCIIENFYAQTYGGGVYHDDGTLSNCIVRNCTSGWQGGGLYINDGGTIAGCTFSGNSAQQGAGVYLYFHGTLHNCTLEGNRAVDMASASSRVRVNATSEPRGGGVYLANGGLVENCLVRGNSAVSGSGVILESRGTVRGCTLTENIAQYYAAAYCQFGGMVEACHISRNTALNAAGVMCDNGGVVRNCVITRNTAQQGAGAQVIKPGLMENCTVAGNVAASQIGGVYASGGAVIDNSIIYHNSAPAHPNLHGSALARYCCTFPAVAGAGNITNAPLLAYINTGFCDLRPGSPCANAGTNLPWMASATDIAGRPRLLNGNVDIGAYEYTNGPIIWADPVVVDFGDVMPGEAVPAPIVVGNAGDELLAGAVTDISAPFTAATGGIYSIAPNATSLVEFVFAPSAVGGYTNDIRLTGGDGAMVSLRGTAIPEAAALAALAVAIAAVVRVRGGTSLTAQSADGGFKN